MPKLKLPDEDTLRAGVKTLRKILRRMRWDDQGGYCSYQGDGKWSFASTSIGQIEGDELNDLFALAGIKPDVIESNGDCEDCVFSLDGGRERGYAAPCCKCSRPGHSHFVQRTATRLKVIQNHPDDHRLYDLADTWLKETA